jgi:hypothetical protein
MISGIVKALSVSAITQGSHAGQLPRPLQRRFQRGHRVTISSMPTDHIVALLIAERDKLSRAIEALTGPTKRRGRPPKKPLAVTTSAADLATLNAAPAPAKKGRRKFTAAQRAAAAERMRQRWAAKKKAEAKSQPKAAGKSKKTAKGA